MSQWSYKRRGAICQTTYKDPQFLDATGTAVLPGDLLNEPDPEEESQEELALFNLL